MLKAEVSFWTSKHKFVALGLYAHPFILYLTSLKYAKHWGILCKTEIIFVKIRLTKKLGWFGFEIIDSELGTLLC